MPQPPATHLAPALAPALAYDDAPAALDWLERAFGFRRRLVVPGPDGTVAHAELDLGRDGARVMLGSVKDDAYRLRPPRRLEGGTSVCLCVVVDDLDAHHARAAAAGAEIVRAPFDTAYGSRDYTARDPEGHVWHFGTYVPGTMDG